MSEQGKRAPGRSKSSAAAPERKACFVVSAFGATPDARKRTEQVLNHMVRKVVEPRGYEVIRADKIHAPGLITHQIIEHLLDDDLVIADLTGNNPNVFYEIAVRHAALGPIVHLLTDGEEIPFDLKDVRTVFYALDDPDRLEEAQKDLGEKVDAMQEVDEDVSNPVAAVRRLRVLQASDVPETREIGEVLTAITDIRDEMRSLAAMRMRVDRVEANARTTRGLGRLRKEIVQYLRQEGPLPAGVLAARLGVPEDMLEAVARTMLESEDLFELADGTYSIAPF